MLARVANIESSVTWGNLRNTAVGDSTLLLSEWVETINPAYSKEVKLIS